MIAADRCVVLDGGDRHRAAARAAGRARARRAAVGHARARRRARRGARRAPPLRRRRLRRDLDEHLGPAERAARGRPAAVGARTRAGALDGRRAARRAARAPGGRRGRPRRRVRRRVQRSTATSTRREGAETIRLLARAFDDEPPDLILLETLSLVRAVARTRRSRRCSRPGLPVWLSASGAAATGVCGVYGAALGRPGGRRASGARRGASRRWASARCWSTASRPTTSTGWSPSCATSPTCRSASTPTSATYTNDGWRFEPGVGGDEYAEMALRWREEGAQIIGGCCGVGPEHIAAARERAGGHAARAAAAASAGVAADGAGRDAARRDRAAALDATAAAATLLPARRSPTSPATRASSCPTQGSFLVWRHLFARAASARASAASTSAAAPGMLTVQLALNGAAHVHAIDIDARGGRQHARQRVPQRRRRPRHGRRRRPLPVGAGGALRGDRREPLPDAGRPVPSRSPTPPPARLLGPQPARPPDRASCPRRSRRDGVAYVDAALDPRPGAHRRAAGRARLRGARSSTSRSSSSTELFARRPRADRARRGAVRRLPPARSATTT